MDATQPEGVELRWIDGPPPAFMDNDRRIIAFDRDAWEAADSRLQLGAGESYRRLATSGEFGRWWPDQCGGASPGIRRFRLRLPAFVWERPWEGLVAGLEPVRWDQVSLIRQAETDVAPPQPSELGDPLQVLCLHGAAGSPGLATLDLAAEFAAIDSAYAEVDFNVRLAVTRPVALPARLDTLESTLLQHRPTILWFSGHGRADPPGLLLDDGGWLTPERLAAAFRSVVSRGGRTPLYVVLWACQTGSTAPFAAPATAPRFIEALCAEGVAGLVAAQAPLSDEAARTTAGHIFSTLASGRPIDHAVARIRGELMQRAGVTNLGQSIAWMCPVVWSPGAPPPSLQWHDRREEEAQRQSAAHKLLPPGLRTLAGELRASDTDGIAWPDVPRLWVTSGSPDAQGARLELARRVLLRQRHAPRMTLFFDLSSASDEDGVRASLRDWADLVMRTIENDDDRSVGIRRAAQRMSAQPSQGWRSLCANEAYQIAIIQPPADGAGWLWEPLRSGGNANAVVLAADYPAERAGEGWTVDAMGVAAGNGGYSKSRLLAALAVLGCPADIDDIQEAAGEPLAPWIERGVVISTSAGCLMPARIAETIATCLDPEERMGAHRLAYAFLHGPDAERRLAEGGREDILLARWRHAQGAEWRENVLEEATLLLDFYQREDRAGAFLTIFSPMTADHRRLPDSVQIGIGWAYLADGQPDKGISWLETIRPDELARAVDAASWFMIRAEAEKSAGRAGAKSRAREFLEAGLKALDEDEVASSEEERERVARARLRCRHDLARLTHFFDHDAAAAVRQYEEVERGWKAIPDSRLDRAITNRNLAEAFMDAGDLTQAEVRIVAARSMIPAGSLHPVVSELEYVAGRVAVRALEKNVALAGVIDLNDVSRRFEVCHQKALATNHLMMVAIVEARLFWREPDQATDMFAEDRWAAIAEHLAPFERHAWAARVTIDGRLRAARRLAGRGERVAARSELAEARRLLCGNPDFQSGSDRSRLAALYAGLTMWDPAAADAWDVFQQRYSWAREWLAREKLDVPAKAWELAG